MPSDVSALLASQLLFLTSAMVGTLALYLSSRPGTSETVFTLALALTAGAVLGIGETGYRGMMVVLCYWALAAWLLSALVPFAFPDQLSSRRRTLLRMLVPPAAIYGVETGLRLNQAFTRETLDYYLYAADASLGDQFAFAAGRLVEQHDWLRLVSEFAYINLPLAATLVYLAIERHSATEARRFLWLVIGMGAAGWISYFVLPGAGLIVVFGSSFPYHPPDLNMVDVIQTPPMTEPRNCMPSLHAAWGLALWWSSPSRPGIRAVLLLYLAPMLLYTLACGHYVVDIVAAVPFTLAVDAATRRATIVSLAAAALFSSWLVTIRFATHVMLVSPAVPWAMAALTIGASWWLRRKMSSDYTTQFRPAALA